MDNSLLLINCDKIEELVLLDEACGSPVDMDWDSTVSEGEIPAVVYEAFDDYMTYKDVGDTPSHYDLSCLTGRGHRTTLLIFVKSILKRSLLN